MAKITDFAAKTTLVDTDILWGGESPYASGDDFKVTFANLKASLGTDVSGNVITGLDAGDGIVIYDASATNGAVISEANFISDVINGAADARIPVYLNGLTGKAASKALQVNSSNDGYEWVTPSSDPTSFLDGLTGKAASKALQVNSSNDGYEWVTPVTTTDLDTAVSDAEDAAAVAVAAAAEVDAAVSPAVDTGLLPRTLLDRVGDKINVLDYFQDDEAAIVARIKARTATSSDAAAIDAAIDAAYAAANAGDAVTLPRGLYCTASTHVFGKDYVTIEFEPGARIEHYGDTDCLVFRPSTYATAATYLSAPEVLNAFITRGDQATTLVAGIRFIKCERPRIVNPRIYQFPIRLQIEGGVYPTIESPQFRNNGPGVGSQNYIAGSRLIGLVASYYNDGSPKIQHCFQVMISNLGCDGVNVDYGIYIEDADGLQFDTGSFAVFKTAQIACVLDADSSSVHQVDLSDIYFDGGLTPHSTPHNIWIDGTNRPTASGGVWTVKGGFIGNDTDGDGIPVLIERQNTSFTLTGGRSTSCDRAVIKHDGGGSGGRLKALGWSFENVDTTSSGDGGAIVANSLESIQVTGCSFDGIPTTPIYLLSDNGNIGSAIFAANVITDCGQDIDRSGATIDHYCWGANTTDNTSPEPDNLGSEWDNFTPTASFSNTDATAWTPGANWVIRYKLMGNTCFFFAKLQTTPTKGSANGALEITLPVAPVQQSPFFPVIINSTTSPGGSMPASTDRIFANVYAAGDVLRFWALGAHTVTKVNLTHSHFPDATQIYFEIAGFYEFA